MAEKTEGKERRKRKKLEEANLRNEYDSCKIHRTIRGSLNVACLSVCLRAYFRSHLYARTSSSMATCSVDKCELVHALNESFYESRIVDMARRKKIKKKVIDGNT